MLSLVLTMMSWSSVWAGPQVVGKAAVLIDSKSGKVLYAKNEHEPLPPASTTKIMTAILALENRKLGDKVVAGKDPALVEPSAIGIREGETFTMENLLYALLLKSANDAAVAIAEEVAGSVPAFAEMMNRKARELGAQDTHFVNPNGLPAEGHVSSAYDLALMAAYAMKNPIFREMVGTKVKTIPRENDDDIKWLENHNKLLWRYKAATGIKTGYTNEARQCVVASAADEDQELIAVVLGSEGNNVWTDAETLLDYGFKNFSTVRVRAAGDEVTTVPVENGTEDVKLAAGDDFYWTIPQGEDPGMVTEKVSLNPQIKAPIQINQVLGQIYFLAGDAELGSVPLIAENAVPEKSLPAPKQGPAHTFLAGGMILGGYVWWNYARYRRKKTRRIKKRWGSSR